MIKTIVLKDDPILSTACKPVAFPLDQEAKDTIQDLKDTTLNIPNAVGVAAPQIGKSLCIFVYNLTKTNKDKTNVVMINPEIIKTYGDKRVDYEACLSYPGYIYTVPAYELLKVSYTDENGMQHKLKIRGFEARVFQHELRHLQGVSWPEDAKCYKKDEINGKERAQ